MPRALRYYIQDTPENSIGPEQWKDIMRLQHWYNSEFIWSCDKIGLKRYILFANYQAMPDMPYHVARYHFRKRLLQKKIQLGDEVAAIHAMVDEGLFYVRWGGVRDNCIASGISHVADNEFNAYLLCEFLLKCSVVATGATFEVEDEGNFILTRKAMIRDGGVMVRREDLHGLKDHDTLDTPQIFAVVSPQKYDDHPRFVESLADLDDTGQELEDIPGKLGDFGFAPAHQTVWGDSDGLNLQQRARRVSLV